MPDIKNHVAKNASLLLALSLSLTPPATAQVNVSPRLANHQKPPQLTSSAQAKLAWPAEGPVIIDNCGGGAYSTKAGITLVLRRGEDVRAVEAGRIAYAGNKLKGFDQVIFIRHDSEWVSVYGVNGRVFVKRGDTVRRGQMIARSDHTNLSGRYELRFELLRHAKTVNPLDYLPKTGRHPRIEHFCRN